MNGDPQALIRQARAFATQAHGSIDQRRRYTNEPYIVHPAAVAKIVSTVTGDAEMIATAWLHDTVEDTEATIEAIEETFGASVAELVWWVTDVSRPEDGNRKARKEIDRQHLAKAPARAKTVKLADLIDNSRSILRHDPKFAAVYIAEKALLLEVLTEGDPTLWQQANDSVIAGQATLQAHQKQA